jgi:hypothetical protein
MLGLGLGCKRGQLGGMEKEEGGQPGPPDQTREFIGVHGESSLRRGHDQTFHHS